jgi:hypothetical protein
MTSVSAHSCRDCPPPRTTGCSLRYSASRPEVAISIPGQIIGFLYLSNPYSRTVALGSIQPITEMSNRNHPGIKTRPERRADNFTSICENVGDSTSQPLPPDLHGFLHTQRYIVRQRIWNFVGNRLVDAHIRSNTQATETGTIGSRYFLCGPRLVA